MKRNYCEIIKLCLNACRFLCLFVCLYVCMFVCLRACVCVCLCLCVRLCVCLCLYVCLFVYVFMYVCVCLIVSVMNRSPAYSTLSCIKSEMMFVRSFFVGYKGSKLLFVTLYCVNQILKVTSNLKINTQIYLYCLTITGLVGEL